MAVDRTAVRAALSAAGRTPDVDAAVLAVDCPNCQAEAPALCRRVDWNACPSRYRAAIRSIEESSDV